MGTFPVNSSTEHSTPTEGAVIGPPPTESSGPRTRTVMPLLYRMTQCIFIGAATGMLLAVLSVFVPNNRVVMYNQGYNTFIALSSVRMKKPGYVVLYWDEDLRGSILSEKSYYLPAGYHTNVMIPINRENAQKFVPREVRYFVRLVPDAPDGGINATSDVAYHDLFGRFINDPLYIGHTHAAYTYAWNSILASPGSGTMNVLFP